MVTISAVAERKIRELIKEEQDAVGLRVYVRGGGVTGINMGWHSSRRSAKMTVSLRRGTSRSLWILRARHS